MAKDDTAEPGRVAQIRTAYTTIKQVDPQLPLWMAGAALLAFLVALGISLLFGGYAWISGIIVGLMLAAMAAMFVMNTRGNKALYGQLDGQRGAVGATLQSMEKRGWYVTQEPVAVDGARGSKLSDMTGATLVFRTVGRPGVVLLAEGPSHARAEKLLKDESRKVTRVAPGVPVHTYVVGSGEGELSLRKLTNTLTKMRPSLTKEETALVNKRLRALGGVRTGVPAGMDPTRARVDRKAMRGR